MTARKRPCVAGVLTNIGPIGVIQDVDPTIIAICEIARRIYDRRKLTREDLAYIGNAFGMTSAGVDPRVALGLTRVKAKGRRPITESGEVLRALGSVAVEVHRARGLFLAAAIERVAADYGRSYATVERYRKRDRSAVRLILFAAEQAGTATAALELPSPRGERKRKH